MITKLSILIFNKRNTLRVSNFKLCFVAIALRALEALYRPGLQTSLIATILDDNYLILKIETDNLATIWRSTVCNLNNISVTAG